ncbi:hypothetical protein ZYGR_0AK05630 [Zygosaccharomyces rouxii]|uniref:Dolichyl-diphosphooligosaccharide--protein glycosyltransferase subunit OST6 n=1 Tax=Zygosaccharomyces rouxii TaxID=4956 RepID=A0A1Q3AEG7_ZYGRO|nr:hypothetical protein ZYGR_0AK05630 [Zygosaccharomyces rouxii]
MKWIGLFCLVCMLWQSCQALIDAEEVAPLEDHRGFIKVNDENYRKLSKGIKDYYTILFLTISDDNPMVIQCDICHELESTLSTVVALARRQAPWTKILMFEADVTENQKLLKDMNLNSIPHVLIFPPPTSKSFKWSVDPFYQYPVSPDNEKRVLHFGNFLAQVLDVHLEISDFDYGEFYKYFIASVVLFIFIKKQVLPRVPNFRKWSTVVVSFIILLTSICGYKFTEINAIPFIARDGNGKIMYFSGGMGWQFGIEIFVVSLMYVGMAALAITLIFTPRFPFGARAQNVQGAVLSCLLFFAFSYYTQCYKIKFPDYPYEF